MNFKVIKFTAFELEDKTKGVNYTVAHQGRVLQFSTLHFKEDEFKVDKGILSISAKIEVVKRPYTNKLGEVVQGLSLMPEFGLALADV